MSEPENTTDDVTWRLRIAAVIVALTIYAVAVVAILSS
jgi:hypothetical protein